MSREFPKNPEPKIALPTVGRIVHVFGLTDFDIQRSTPRAALVAFVDPIDSLAINVGVWNTDGTTRPLIGLKHASLPRHVSEPYWDWMDFQKGQAAKTEQLEAKLKENSSLRTSPLPGTYGGNEMGKLQAGAPSPDKRASGPEEDGKR